MFTGQYSSYRKKRHGSSVKERPTSQFVVFSQNHDQVGNRMHGDRLSANLPLEKLTLAAATVILSPYLPLLFMGEEFGEKAPFQYFVSFSDPALIEAVRPGRREEFAAWAWSEGVPDPEDEATFLASKIDLTARKEGEQALIHKFYRQLLALRKNIPPLSCVSRDCMAVVPYEEHKVLAIRRHTDKSAAVCLFSFSDRPQEVKVTFSAGEWEKILDSSAAEWGGRGEVAARAITADANGSWVRLHPFSAVVYFCDL